MCPAVLYYFAPHSFETGSLTKPEARLVARKLRGPPVSVAHSAGVTVSDMPDLLHWCLDLNSNPHAYTSSVSTKLPL